MRMALLALLISGCGGGVAFGDFDREFLDASCGYYVRCGLVASDAECRAYFERSAIDNPNPAAAIEAGRLRYHEDTAQDCIDAYTSLSCDITEQGADDLAACLDVFTGAQPTGTPCAFDGECESDNCQVPSCPDACCVGTCGARRALPGVGEPCTAVCTEDAYCGADSICHALIPQGGACDAGSVCEPDLYCAGASTTGSGTCTPLPHLGEPCETQCAELGAICVGGTCVAAGLDGDACESANQCSYFYTCGTGGTCGAYPALGMPCTGRCSGDAYCMGGTCVAQKPNGESCTFNDDCVSHYCGDGACSDVPLCI